MTTIEQQQIKEMKLAIKEIQEIVRFTKNETVTKKDLTGLATKNDLTGLATMGDLSGLATKKDLTELATKKDLAEIYEVVSFIKDNAIIRDEFLELKGEVTHMNKRLTRVESLMVTKDYLDDKLADLRGDMVSFVHKKLATQ